MIIPLCCSVNPYIWCLACGHDVCRDHFTKGTDSNNQRKVRQWIDGWEVSVCDTCLEKRQQEVLRGQKETTWQYPKGIRAEAEEATHHQG